MFETCLIDGARTAIGKRNGIFKNILPEKLAAVVLNEIINKNNLQPENIDAVVMGNIIGPGGNIARVSVLEAGWPYEIPAFTIDVQCSSGLTAVDMAAAMIVSGRADLVIAGGVESTSLAPRRYFSDRDPRKKNDGFYEQAPFSPEWVGNPDIGMAAEFLVDKFNISREQMDELALKSHQKACVAEDGCLRSLIVPVWNNGHCFSKDEGPKKNMSMKLLSRLSGAFKENGNITAGNSCLKHDGAALLLVASQAAVKKYGLVPQALLYPAVNVGCDPNFFPLGPINAIKKLQHIYNFKMECVEAVEINEAFAVQIIVCCKALNIPLDLVNQMGGAIAFGHPYGASGAIILLHLLRTLRTKQKKMGIASIGAVGGLGTAILMKGF
ncbi:thiolase family protein [Pectinatus sottacetonis]|uniref:thiolase family protein n=1 Tax=Pectinatus sottacetonis TaxID=1002795 RepID=UPI0018C5DC02|nr:thiolase family protein [Pectinatus sottacetonis]